MYVCFLKRSLSGHLYVECGVMRERKIMKDKSHFKVISNENISFCVSRHHSRMVEAAVG
jgi:hypothetical protein